MHLPLKPIKKLIVNGPYRFCRNPLILGMIVYYFGLTVWFGSFYALFLFSIFIASFILYMRYVKEGILEDKFGDEYVKYREKTPFLIPRLKFKDKK